MVAVLDHAAAAARPARPVVPGRARAQQAGREVEREGVLAHGRRPHEQQRVGHARREHRADGTRRGRLADGPEAVHAGFAVRPRSALGRRCRLAAGRPPLRAPRLPGPRLAVALSGVAALRRPAASAPRPWRPRRREPRPQPSRACGSSRASSAPAAGAASTAGAASAEAGLRVVRLFGASRRCLGDGRDRRLGRLAGRRTACGVSAPRRARRPRPRGSRVRRGDDRRGRRGRRCRPAAALQLGPQRLLELRRDLAPRLVARRPRGAVRTVGPAAAHWRLAAAMPWPPWPPRLPWPP